LNIVVETRGTETLSRDLADGGTLPSGTYRLRVTARSSPISFSSSNAAFQFTLALRVGPALVAAVLPSGRSVQVGTPATAFATVINFGADTALACALSPVTNLLATFSFAPTDPATNQVIGPPDTPVNIQPGGSQSFVFDFTPTDIIASQDVVL